MTGRQLFIKSTTNTLALTREAIEFIAYVDAQLAGQRKRGSTLPAFAPRTLQFVERVRAILPKAVGGDVADVLSTAKEGATKPCQKQTREGPHTEQAGRKAAGGSKARLRSKVTPGQGTQAELKTAARLPDKRRT